MVALESAVGKMRRYLGDPTLIFDPCDYGDPYKKKRTLLWGRFTLPAKSRETPLGGRSGQPNPWFSKVGGTSDKTKAYRRARPPFFKAHP